MIDADATRVTIGDLLDRQADRLGDHDALVHVEHGVRHSYASLRDECDRFARGLMSLGVARGQHVGIWATNYVEWVIAQFAVAKIGAVLVTVNPAYRTHELEYVLRQADIHVLILIGRFRTSDYVAMLNEVVPEIGDSVPGRIQSARLPHLRHVIYIPPVSAQASVVQSRKAPAGMWLWRDVIEAAGVVDAADLATRQSEIGVDDLTNIQYTSGTTGSPKGAMLTHHNVVANATHFGRGLHLTEADRLCVPVPFYHCFGCVLSTLCCVAAGATLVIPAEHFDPLKTLEAVERERCTVLHGVPTMFIAELAHPEFDRFDLSTLRTGMMSGAPCPMEVMRKVLDRMGAREITIGYGQTEAAPVITLTDTKDPIERRVTTVGKPLPTVEVRIVDPDTGEEVPRGEQGELRTRSSMVMRGYYKMPEATSEAIDEAGWLHTGDLATMDDDGYCSITGRIKDMIIRAGENIYPREIEEFLYSHPKVAEVHVVGVPDPEFGEQVVAWIKLRPGETAAEEEFRDFCRERIAHFKIPRYVLFASDMPMTVSGKIQKFRLREMALQRIQSGDRLPRAPV